MRRIVTPGTLAVIGLLALTAAPVQANDASVRTTISQFQPGLARAGKSFASALKGKPTAAAYARLDAATIRFLGTLKLDHAALAAQHASSPKVAGARQKLLASLSRLSQSATHLDKGIQAAKVGNKSGAVANIKTGLIELRRAIRSETQAAALLH